MAHETDDDVGRPDTGVQPCPGHQVVANCDLPFGTHEKPVVHPGCPGEIVRTPAYFSKDYSIRFQVNGRDVTLHRIKSHEFRIVGSESKAVPPGFPPTRRYPQPRPVVASAEHPQDSPDTAPLPGDDEG